MKNIIFIFYDTNDDDEKAFEEMKKEQIKTKLKYCIIILGDKELRKINIFNLFKHPTKH